MLQVALLRVDQNNPHEANWDFSLYQLKFLEGESPVLHVLPVFVAVYRWESLQSLHLYAKWIGNINTIHMIWFILLFSKVWLLLYLSKFASNLRPPEIRTWCRKWALPPRAHLHSHTLKPEPQEVVLRSILSGQTNYSPFEKCTFSSFPIFSLLHLCSLPVFSSPFIVFIAGPPERSSQGDRKLCYLRYLKMNCIRSQNELLLWLHRPQNSRKYSPAVFPQEVWYSCPQYPHNACGIC